MKELSIFVDESGDFGAYAYHSPYYIITMVMHDQSKDLTPYIDKLEHELAYLGLPGHCVHHGPVIRKEEDYRYMDMKQRRSILNKMVAFAKQLPIKYKCFYIEKKHIQNGVEASGKLAREISIFIRAHYDKFLSYDTIKIYYDNGQIEVNKILSSVFYIMLGDVRFCKVVPSSYRLFQVADLLCTFELLRLKEAAGRLSKSEMEFFGNVRDLKKNYLKALAKKEFNHMDGA